MTAHTRQSVTSTAPVHKCTCYVMMKTALYARWCHHTDTSFAMPKCHVKNPVSCIESIELRYFFSWSATISQTILKYTTIVSLSLSSSLYLLMLYSTKAIQCINPSPHVHANAAVPHSDWSVTVSWPRTSRPGWWLLHMQVGCSKIWCHDLE